MANTIIDFDKEARNKLLEGINAVADAVKITIGPKGKNVAIKRGKPLITNDGGTIARSIHFKDEVKQMGAQIIQNVIEKTSDVAGGGRTASAILTQELVTKGLNYVDMGMDMNSFAEGMNQAKDDIKTELTKMARPVKNQTELEQLATISTESKDLGKVIAETMWKIGKDGIVTVEESQTFGITTELADGLKFDNGYISQFMITNEERLEAEYKDVPVYVTDKKITMYKDIFPIIDKLVKSGTNSLIIFAEDFDGDALNKSIMLKLAGQFNILAIKNPGFGDLKKYCLEDICALTGAKVAMNDDYTLGKIGQIIATKDTTKLINGNGDLKTHITTLKTQRELTENKVEINRLDERIAKLSNSVAIIKVGTSSDTKLNYLKQKVEDGVNECKRALEDGIVIGGNVAFIHAIKKLKAQSGNEVALGYNTVLDSTQSPLRQIAINSRGSGDVIMNILVSSKTDNVGYNALTNAIVDDMFKEGIIDAVKVPITILENAVDEVSTFLTIGATLSEEIVETK